MLDNITLTSGFQFSVEKDRGFRIRVLDIVDDRFLRKYLSER